MKKQKAQLTSQIFYVKADANTSAITQSYKLPPIE